MTTKQDSCWFSQNPCKVLSSSDCSGIPRGYLAPQFSRRPTEAEAGSTLPTASEIFQPEADRKALVGYGRMLSYTGGYQFVFRIGIRVQMEC